MVCIAFAFLLACKIGHFAFIYFLSSFWSSLLIDMSSLRQTNNSHSVALSNLLSVNIVHTEPESRSIGCLVCNLTSFFSLNRPSPYIVLMLSYIFSINVVYRYFIHIRGRVLFS